MGESKQYKVDVRRLRLKAKLKLREVSEALGISAQSLSDWELGMLDLKFRIEQTKKLMEIYNVTFDQLAEAWSETERQPTRQEVKQRAKEAVEKH